ncbi:carbohydrate binding domain-containing protein [Massilia glaciei]|uniref:Alpha-amylase n=1 Tax=Massilia glaciei TaxID=1524097 RepID=A0A2U2HIR3_9BURK|nr:carbohydrate binding domain-containing protein [Massilia glaciei]PWF46669.1 alpha-amylase [Massilia glaciei]
MVFRKKPLALCLAAIFAGGIGSTGWAGPIPAAHLYHNHMPNFWPFYAVDVMAKYNATALGAPVRYLYDGEVIALKQNPPSGYSYFLPASLGGAIMPHDDLVAYYSHDAKTGAYQYWPMQVANEMQNWSGAKGQVHVTMSGAVINNVQSLTTLQNVPGYSDSNWGQRWADTFSTLKTVNNQRTLDTVHFTGHHTMGPLVGADYFLKDLIYQNVTLAQPHFLGSKFVSSKGFFPTELGFSDRLIPTLAKLGVQWSVLGNNHFSRTLKDYPYATYDATGDTIVSPPNRADLRNTSSVGSWVAAQMAHEQQVIVNKFPFASTPHWVRHVDPHTGAVSKIAGIPVSQNGSWLEGWEGSTTVDEIAPYAALEPRQFFVVAHDGDNSSGRAGALSTWQAGHSTTCAGNGYCLGIDEYLKAKPIPATDVQHVQDGSWVDTRDSSSDPTWYHWRLPFLIWKGQFAEFNRVNGTNLSPKVNLKGLQEGATVSFEYGWHYLERNFALLQASMNYAKTSEQIWLDAHPAHWSPTTALDNQVTHPGNQLNPWMMSYPVKGNAGADYAGGANPAELAWYFLLPAMDSGFGYYDENKDDSVKPTLAFNNSLAFSKPYVAARLPQDRTGPSMWWPQRYPYNPGSVNASKAEGWTVQHYSNDFAIYTYAYDLSGITNATVKVRVHASNNISAIDDTYKVFDPAAMVGKPGLSVTPANVGAWQSYPMQVRDLRPDMNGVAWNAPTRDTLAVLPAQETGDLYYTYLSNYRNQLLDYYIELTDAKGNVTKSEIQQVHVGAGTYSPSATGSGFVENTNGTVQGVYPFLVVDSTPPSAPGPVTSSQLTDRSVKLAWTASTDNVAVTGYKVFRDNVLAGSTTTNSFTDSALSASTAYSYTMLAFDAAGNQSGRNTGASITTRAPDAMPPTVPGKPVASGFTSSSLVLGWTASTDNYGVAQYNVLRNGVKIGTSAVTSFSDTGLSPATVYNYTIEAVDAAGNVSAQSASTAATTAPGNVAKVYYRLPAAWSMANMHFSPTGGTWTAVPGVPMSIACAGWAMHSVNLGSATGLQAAFNNGSGSWDSNAGKNYALGSTISSVENGGVTSGVNPCDIDTQSPTAPTAVAAAAIDANTVSVSWNASTDNVRVAGYYVFRNNVQIASVVNGTGHVDNTAAPATGYSYAIKAYDAAGNISGMSAAAAVTTPVKPDTVAPSVPAGLIASAVGSNSAGISWSASTDNVGVAGYQLLRNGVPIASTAARSFNDSGLAAGTSYNYTVKAQDTAGNTSAASAALVVTTTPVGGNSATVYYRNNANWATVNIHYAPTGGNWTVVPGLVMETACTGWKSKVIALGAAGGLQAAFNNNAGTWDSKGGANYAMGTGISAVNGAALTTTNPCTGGDILPPSTPTALASNNVGSGALGLSWAASTDNVGVSGYRVLRNAVQVGSSATNSFTDTGLAASTSYSFTVLAFDAAGNTSPASGALSVTTTATAGCQVRFTTANAATVTGQSLRVVGNAGALGSWAPAGGFGLTIQGSGANVPWSGTVTLPVNTTVQYKYAKWNGTSAVWEGNQATPSGNRELTTPASCGTVLERNDGNFKF